MTTVTVIYAVMFYVATASLVIGLAFKIFLYARTPQPLKIPTTPAPLTRLGVAWRITKEVVVFASLFKSNKWLWLFGWLFHFALLLALFHHLDVFFGSFAALRAVSDYAGFGMTLGLAGLWARRILIDRIRYISAPSDHLMLALLLGIALSGLAMRYLAYPDILMVRAYFAGLAHFDWQPPLPAEPLLLLHLALVAILMAVLPVSKLLHAPGLFFSPTFNQVDDARERRYTSGWSAGKRGGP